MENIIGNIKFTAPWWPLILPLIFIAADIVSGWIQAHVNSCWDSTKMYTGFFRKGGEILILFLFGVIASAFDRFESAYAVAAVYLTLMEFISVCENLDKAGVPLPTWLIKRLKKVKDTLDGGIDDTEPRDEVQAAIMRTFDGREGKK